MNPISLLEKYYEENRGGFEIVLEHSSMVAGKALAIARGLSEPGIDLGFLEEAALLHDIGVSRTSSPRLGCKGAMPYICHGILGREILESEGFPFHALVCERHIGVGIGVKDIVQQRLPLPKRDMTPISIEEKIICFADLFYSKKPGGVRKEKSPDEIRASLMKHGAHKVAVFEAWLREFMD